MIFKLEVLNNLPKRFITLDFDEHFYSMSILEHTLNKIYIYKLNFNFQRS